MVKFFKQNFVIQAIERLAEVQKYRNYCIANIEVMIHKFQLVNYSLDGRAIFTKAELRGMKKVEFIQEIIELIVNSTLKNFPQNM